jgi:hypothetical protein
MPSFTHLGDDMMRNSPCVFLMCAALLFQSGIATAQQKAGDNATSDFRELWSLKSTDDRSRNIEAIALGRSGKSDVLFVVEGVQTLRPKGTTGPTDGEYVLWMLDTNGRVLKEEFIADCPYPRPPSRVMIVPLPEEGAIVIGMFEDEKTSEHLSNVYSFLQVNGSGNIVKSTRLSGGACDFVSAKLLPNAKGLLLAGSRDFGGGVAKVDLDGNMLWRKEYLSKTDMSKTDKNEKVVSYFTDIVPIDEKGAFIAAGDFGKLNKFGLGEHSIWLVKCNAEGEVLTETTFSGRQPSIQSLEKDRFAVRYDVGAGFMDESRVRAIDLELKQQWEIMPLFASMFLDGSAMCMLPSGQGFALAGCNIIPDKEKRTAHRECQFYQYDAKGQVISSAKMPIEDETFLHAHIACGADRAYVAIQTKGMGPWDVREAGVFEIQLKKQTP